ncbi:hypothetical protein A9Q84_17895 [Halobacteriovorax marinus]|uniref:Uncharacterized protein n=1 Tax=Halobacteriovorax marinus TaxID=97084 RepID=A0A1Y5F3C4_9BACT|nr:hypothetical protein A9Q84_17895 [Halobacteriovorax marinus]
MMKILLITLVFLSSTFAEEDLLTYSKYEREIIKQLKDKNAHKSEYFENYLIVSEKLYEKELYKESLHYYRKALTYKEKPDFQHEDRLCFLLERNGDTGAHKCYSELAKDQRIFSLAKVEPQFIMDFYLRFIRLNTLVTKELLPLEIRLLFIKYRKSHLLDLNDAVILVQRGKTKAALKMIKRYPKKFHDYQSALIQDIIERVDSVDYRPHCLKLFKGQMKVSYYTVDMCKELSKKKKLKTDFFTKYLKKMRPGRYQDLRKVLTSYSKSI